MKSLFFLFGNVRVPGAEKRQKKPDAPHFAAALLFRPHDHDVTGATL
jgi:hypothetical protein